VTTATGRVFLIGAGPGDPGLITARGLRLLALADVVLYDALVHPDILDACRPDAERVFVGKRAGKPGERQALINERLIAQARAGHLVARLKGGDPFLFGRGAEEAEVLQAAGVPFEVVPGVPSPAAAAAHAGISLTHRELSSSVAYVTATESADKDRSSHDWTRLATATDTLVIFMGLRKLDSLMALLVEHGRPADTPAAVIQWGGLPRQRTVVGTVGTIAGLAREADLGMPALTIVGHVVRLRETLRWYDTRPLFGQRVLVTRPSEQARSLSLLLRDEGAEPIEAPSIRIVPPEDPAPLAAAVQNLSAYDWVVFTSRNGVVRFFAEVRAQGGDARRLGGARVAAIGPATAEGLEAFGVRPDQIPGEYRGEAVAEMILAHHNGALGSLRVLLPRAAVARETLPETLRQAGAHVDVVAAYRSLPPDAAGLARLRALVTGGEVSVVTFTASSTVASLLELLGDGAVEALRPLTVASIGPITTATAERAGVRVDVTAKEYTNAGLVSALVTHFSERQ